MHYWVDGWEKDGDEPTVTVPARDVRDWLKTQRCDEVTITITPGEKTVFRAESAEATFQTMDVELFPQVPTGPEGDTIVIGEEYFDEALERTLFAITDDISRPMLASIKIESVEGGQQLRFQGADGNRLSVAYTPYHGGEFDALITGKILHAVKGLSEGTIEIGWAGSEVVFASGNWVLSSHTTQQKYPDFSPFFTKTQEDMSVIVKMGPQTKAQVESVMVFAKQNDNLLRVRVKEDRLAFSSYVEVGSGEATVPCTLEKGEEIEFLVNGAYFVDALKAGSDLSLWMVDEKQAVQLVEEDKTFLNFIMPMQLR